MENAHRPRPDNPADEEMWRVFLSGDDAGLRKLRGFFLRFPSNPRCKVCASPFGGIGGGLARIFWHAPLARNPLLCRACDSMFEKHPGGAEIEVSVLFADVRGSTGLAEGTSPAKFRKQLQAFYDVAWKAIPDWDGIIDKFLGDGVMALFIPAIAGERHAERAVAAGRQLLAGVASLPEPRLPVGAGIHSGVAYVGIVGSAQDRDFSALGDVVNVAARLGSEAKAGELLVSSEAARAAAVNTDAPPHLMALKGRHEPLEVISL
jgi:adenylate cyclase